MKKKTPIADYFVGHLLAPQTGTVQRSKILLCLYLPLGYSVIALLAFPLIVINEIWILLFTSILGISLNFLTPFILKKTRSVKISSIYFSTINLFNATTSFILLGSYFDLAAIPYFFLQAIFMTFLLNIRWASWFSLAYLSFLTIIHFADLKGAGFDRSLLTPESYSLSILFNLILVFSLLLYLLKQFHQSEKLAVTELNHSVDEENKLNQKLSSHHDLIKEQEFIGSVKNKEIRDSLAYSSNIQNALLPSLNKLERTIKESFVIHLPKGAVSHDFYWTHVTGKTQVWSIANYQATGIPGGLVTIMGQNTLNDLASNKRMDSAQMLTEMHESIRSRFSNHKEIKNNGLNMGICTYDSSMGQVTYAGANISLYHIKAADNSLHIITPLQREIGTDAEQRPIQNHLVNVAANDVLVMMTDAYMEHKLKTTDNNEAHDAINDELMQLVDGAFEQSSIGLSEGVIDSISPEQLDDITILALRL